jgi:hypothetical protein
MLDTSAHQPNWAGDSRYVAKSIVLVIDYWFKAMGYA